MYRIAIGPVERRRHAERDSAFLSVTTHTLIEGLSCSLSSFFLFVSGVFFFFFFLVRIIHRGGLTFDVSTGIVVLKFSLDFLPSIRRLTGAELHSCNSPP